MFNPFIPFSFGLIQAFRDKGKRYLVAQTFTRADPAEALGRPGILLTHYDDPGLAKAHLNAQKHDKYACIVDLENDKHRAKVEEMIAPLSAYSVWAAIALDPSGINNRLEMRYSKNIRRYITNNTNWRIKGDSTFNVKMNVVFGDLQIVLKYSSREEIRVKLEEIEKS